jgi:protein phosphatase 1 regulatory subunit 7
MSANDEPQRPEAAPTQGASDTSAEKKGAHKHSNSASSLQNAKGWDGKLRVERRAVLVNPEVLDGHASDPEDSEDEGAVKVDQIEADEGMFPSELGGANHPP